MDVVKEHPPAPKISRSSVIKLEQTVAPSSLPGTQTELRQLMQSVSFTVTCLWRIPIRRPAPIDRIKDKSAAETSYYQPFDILYVKDKLPFVDESVANRLGKLISKRRQIMQYRKGHTDALQSITIEPRHTAERRVAELGGTTSVGDLTAPSKSAPSRQTQEEKATTLRLPRNEMELQDVSRLYAPSMPESRTTAASDQAANTERVIIPPRPVGKNGKPLEQFVCPYCSVTQIIKSERSWKKHVLEDLQPYACTYPACELQEYLFENREEWNNHETQHHRLEWSCNTQDHQCFVELPSFLEHMAGIHDSSLNERQIQASRGMFQRPVQSHSGVCTLCHKQATKLKIHVSRHLEQMSLFAIPPADMMKDLDSDISGSGLSHRNINGSKSKKALSRGSGSLSRISDDVVSHDDAGTLAHPPNGHWEHVQWTHRSFEECRALGLKPQWEKLMQATFPKEVGMLVVEKVFPARPMEIDLTAGDMLITVNKTLVATIDRLNQILDDNVDGKFPALVQRGREDVNLDGRGLEIVTKSADDLDIKQTSVPDMDVDESTLDNSWDHITPKFREARAAMYPELLAQPPVSAEQALEGVTGPRLMLPQILTYSPRQGQAGDNFSLELGSQVDILGNVLPSAPYGKRLDTIILQTSPSANNAPSPNERPRLRTGFNGQLLAKAQAFASSMSPSDGQAATSPPGQSPGDQALQDYREQLKLLDQENKKRLVIARQEQDSIAQPPSGQPLANAQEFGSSMLPSDSQAGISPNPNDLMSSPPGLSESPMADVMQDSRRPRRAAAPTFGAESEGSSVSPVSHPIRKSGITAPVYGSESEQDWTSPGYNSEIRYTIIFGREAILPVVVPLSEVQDHSLPFSFSLHTEVPSGEMNEWSYDLSGTKKSSSVHVQLRLERNMSDGSTLLEHVDVGDFEYVETVKSSEAQADEDPKIKPKLDITPSDRDHYQQRPVCGASIGAYRDGLHLPPATFGGIVLVDGKHYGLSVHHMLEVPSDDEESDDGEPDDSGGDPVRDPSAHKGEHAPVRSTARKAKGKSVVVSAGLDLIHGKLYEVDATWTKIDRRLVNAEALEEAQEPFEEREDSLDSLYVLRVLTKKEIQKLADRTKRIRDKRSRDEHNIAELSKNPPSGEPEDNSNAREQRPASEPRITHDHPGSSGAYGRDDYNSYSDDDMEVRSSFEGGEFREIIGTVGDVEGIRPGKGEQIIITQPAIDDVAEDLFPSLDDRDEDHLHSHALGHVYASSGIRRLRRRGILHEIDWALIKIVDERLAPWNVVHGGGQFCIDAATAARQDSPRVKREPDWHDYYKNGLPKEVIVIDDDDDETSPSQHDQPEMNRHAIAKAVEDIPGKLPQPLIAHLLTIDQVERALEWLRTCFEPDSSCKVSLIALENAYMTTFEFDLIKHWWMEIDTMKHWFRGLPNEEFYGVFPTASITTYPEAEAKKNSIHGIRPRKDDYPVEVARADELADRKVHWYGRTSGLQSGVISSTMRQVRFYGRETFAALWSVSGGAKGGDTGAWVIDDRSRVCGYLIATSEAKQVAYMCPMEVVMEDIKQTLGAESVCLPGSAEAKERLERKFPAQVPRPLFPLGAKVQLRITNNHLMNACITDRRWSPGLPWEYQVRPTRDDVNQDNVEEHGEWFDQSRIVKRK
ncbi:hypothetical protein BU16DRAFT_159462 [Lophium mytilinum]|uniref:PDZ domain-containing protein n=1 Tax=Lophium mytilinum TaxID=390894 RepID=A0A6A6QG50_9PEZI|nr:hypothetical protein BU16DRAFT_159462 [Lophium mytilinum]